MQARSRQLHPAMSSTALNHCFGGYRGFQADNLTVLQEVKVFAFFLMVLTATSNLLPATACFGEQGTTRKPHAKDMSQPLVYSDSTALLKIKPWDPVSYAQPLNC